MPHLIFPTDDSGSTPSGKLYSLDPSDGSTNWVVDKEFSNSSPTAQNGSVYYSAGQGTVYSIDVTDGSENWSFSVDNSNNVGFPVSFYNGNVFAFEDPNYIYSLSKSGGTKNWRTTTTNDVIGGQYVTLNHLYVNTTSNIIQLDVNTGAENWSHAMDSSNYASTPTLYKGAVYTGDVNGNLYSVDADTGTRNWKVQPTNGGIRPPIVIGGTIYYVDSTGTVAAVKASDGSILWTSAVADDSDYGAVIYGNGSLYLADGFDSQTNQYVYKVNKDDGSVLFETQIETDTNGTPTFFDGNVYFFDENSNVYSVTNTGAVDWKVSVSGNPNFGGPTYVKDGSSVGARVGQRVRSVNTGEWTLGSIGQVGDDTPIWRSEIIFGDQNKQVLLENTSYTE